jgi:TolB protein
MNTDGSEQTRLTNDPNIKSHLIFSPDGSKIAFFSNRDGNEEIYIMNIDGSHQTNLTNNPNGDAFPVFQP